MSNCYAISKDFSLGSENLESGSTNPSNTAIPNFKLIMTFTIQQNTMHIFPSFHYDYIKVINFYHKLYAIRLQLAYFYGKLLRLSLGINYLMGSFDVIIYQARRNFCHHERDPRARRSVICMGLSPSCTRHP